MGTAATIRKSDFIDAMEENQKDVRKMVMDSYHDIEKGKGRDYKEFFEELAAREIRKCYYKNYKIYFFIDERIRTVYVLRVLHMLVNAKPLLLNMIF